ncbi:uncharacterized protein LOC105383303 isoform X2 [Plutella xylostella]|uniref:uncharacterized protein LOC105383303 isoform X2 n=1 Tax=Plutella xylostella TaxID=51655 RepID=UPI002032A88A|nr:uncharacterized protein LOC105383303 isoform X2 [Plutella xylostella]
MLLVSDARGSRAGLWWAAAVVALAAQVACLHGPNVCIQQQKYNVTKRVKYRAPMSVRSYEWCFAVPPRCSRWTTEMRDLTRLENEERTAEVAVCCPGYKMKDITCIPVCPSGKTGHKCTLDCPLNKWGPNCTYTCKDCVHGKCSPTNGQCLCQEGWQGESCEIKSSPPIPSSTTERENILTTSTLTVPKSLTVAYEQDENLLTTAQSTSAAETILTTKLDPVTTSTHPETITTTTVPPVSSTTTKLIPILNNSDILAGLDETEKASTERPNVVTSDSSTHLMRITTEKRKNETELNDIYTTTIENNISVVKTEQSGVLDDKTNAIHPTISTTTQTQMIYTNATLHPWHKTTSLVEERIKQSILEPIYNIMKTPDLRNTITESATNSTIPVQKYKSTSYGTTAPTSTSMPTLKNTHAVYKTTRITTTKKPEVISKILPATNKFKPKEIWIRPTQKEPEHITAMIDDKGTKTSSLDLISLLSIAGGVMMSIITVAVIIVMIERCRRPKYEDIRRANQLHMKTMMDTNGPPPSYSRRGFHAPLPDPPTLDKSCHYQPISTLDRNLKQFMRPVTVQAISPIMIENFRGILECHYDHLPQRRQFEENINTAPSMSSPHEPLYTQLSQMNSIQHEARLEVLDPSLNEPLYAEIPCWRPPSEHAIEILTINSEAVTEL